MKKIAYSVTLMAISSLASGQESKTANVDFATGLQKIARAFPVNYSNIQGAALSSDGNSSTFASLVCFTGAISCEIRKYTSVKDRSASWTALLYEGEDFSEAAKTYRNTCSNLRKTTVDIGGGQTLGFNGSTTPPNESLRFTGTKLKTACKHSGFLKLIAAVELVSNYIGWEVRLNLYSGNNLKDED